MSERESAIWGIHAGEWGQVDGFFEQNYVALGWPDAGDLSKLTRDREAFKKKVAESYPELKPGAMPVSAGQLFRFVYELKPGDLIVYPCKQDRQVHLGRVEGAYRYDPSLNADYPNIRPVTWVHAYPRSHFTQGALNELGSSLSFFQVDTSAAEFRAAFVGKDVSHLGARDGSAASVTKGNEDRPSDVVSSKRTAQSARTQVFISYSHKDARYLAEVRAHLAMHARNGGVVFCDDTMITPGSQWRDEIGKALASAKVAVLLVSVDFLASEFIAEKGMPALLTAAEAEGARIFPVILRPCAFLDTELARFQTVNKPSEPVSGMSRVKREELWVQVARLVRDELKA